jgi:DNA adenine methylase
MKNKNMKKIKPFIRWMGSKMNQLEEISTIIYSKKAKDYYEPFLGSGSIFSNIYNGQNFENYYISDINRDLISSFNVVKESPEDVVSKYTYLYSELNKSENRRVFYEEIRDEFNNSRNPFLFIFLTRTCMMGKPQYNKFGNFTTGLDLFYPGKNIGMNPSGFEKIVYEWNVILNRENVFISNTNYSEINISENDFAYLDPPYKNSKKRSLYVEQIEKEKSLLDWVNMGKFQFVMNYGKEKMETHLDYKYSFEIKTAKSGFGRIYNKDVEKNVDTVYVK